MDRKYKNGESHPTKKNMVFWSYIAGGNKEQWCSRTAYLNKIAKRKEYQKSEHSQEYQRNWYLKNKEKKSMQSKISLKKRVEQAPLRCLFSSCRSSNKKRGFEFNINVEFIENLWINQKGLCYYTGIRMKYDAFKKDPFQVSIDRIDSKKGYTEENAVLCCQSINYMKNNYPIDQFKEFYKALKLIK